MASQGKSTPEQSRRYRAAYLAKFPDAENKAAQKYRDSNKDKVSVYQKAYRETTHGKQVHALAESCRRARKRNAKGQCSLSQWESRKAMWGGKCWLKLADCKIEGTTIDHVIPLSKGGTNWPANLRPACKSCNSRKHNKRIS
jgi:5-methylcytosine-specific restriction endonuclease McrA